MTQIVLDEDAIASLCHVDEVQQKVQETADELAQTIRDLTPEMSTPQTEDSDAAEPGEMAASIEVMESPRSSEDGSLRVVAMDGRFHWIEFGTGMRENAEGAERGEMPAFAPFRQAADSSPSGTFVPGDDTSGG